MSLQTLFEGDVFKQTKVVQVGTVNALNMNNDTIGDISNNGNLVNGVTIEDGKAFTATDDPPAIDTELSNKKYVDDQVAGGSVWNRTVNDIAPLVAGGILNIDNIVEETGAAGTTINSVLLENNAVTLNLLTLPATTSSTVGVIRQGAFRLIHSFGNNVFFGPESGNFTLSGANNTCCGRACLSTLTTGSSNVAVGEACLNVITTGSQNTAIGGQLALFNNVAGSDNVAVGFIALAGSTSSNNTAVGSSALSQVSSGAGNTGVGHNAGDTNTIGANNTYLGKDSDSSVNNLSNAMALGFNASVNASNKVRVGDANVTVIEGEVDWTFTSDVNKKENFLPVDGELVLKKISGMKQESWNYKGHDKKLFRHYGPMAQTFYELFGNDSVGSINGGVNTTINGGDLSGILLCAVKALEYRTRDIEILKAKVADLELLIRNLQ